MRRRLRGGFLGSPQTLTMVMAGSLVVSVLAGSCTASQAPAGLARTAQAICGGPAAGGTAGSAAPRAAIRVDQGGYPAGAGKLAEIMTSGRRPGPPGWLLVRGAPCTITSTGTASRDLGRWSRRYPAVWRISFSGVKATGWYRIGLAGDPSIVSPWFEIAPAQSLYARPLANALAYYQAQRDGPGYLRSPLRTAPAHLADSRAMTYRTPAMNASGNFAGSLSRYATGRRINASGGWLDAGDYLKFTETISYTAAVMLQGIVSFPGQMGAGAPASFLAEARFGLDFLQRMWDQRTRTLYYQVGIGEANSRYAGDHDLWRLPQADDHYAGTDPRYRYIRHPPVLRAGPPGTPVSPNLAGRLAAGFALCYRVFRGSDPGYANRCLRSAETVYVLAGTHWRGPLLTAAPFSSYPEVGWQDDMMLGATELALALRAAPAGRLPAGLPVRSPATYLRQAAAWARQWVTGPQASYDTLNLYDVSGLAEYELARVLGQQRVSGLAINRAGLVAALRARLTAAIQIARKDPFGLGFAWDQYDTAAHGAGLSVMAHEYTALTGPGGSSGWAQHWLDAILGANAWGVSFIVGDGSVFPHCPHNQFANLAGSLDGRPPVLAGATVEGPNAFASRGAVTGMRPCAARAPGGVPYPVFSGHGAVFADSVQSYSTVEPGIDLTVLTPLAFAWQVAAAHGTVPPP